MTEPERPTVAPSGGPTPEEISARLEALLKRTHALRAERAASPPGPPLSVTWPPPDRELDRYDVVDVPEDARTTPPTVVPPPAAAPPPPHAFSRPDWGELRLRTAPAEPPARAPWLGIVAATLALVAVAEGAYIWYARPATPVVEQGHLRVDGPDGAEVRLDGQRLGTAPLDQDLAPGVYQLEVVSAGASSGRQRVPIGLGRTVVVLPMPAAPAPATTEASPTIEAPDAGPLPQTATPQSPLSAQGDASVSETTGAVDIDSTPSGLPVTMGGRARGVTPLTLGQVKPGRHDVMVGGVVRQVDVRAGQVTTLRVSR